MKIALLLLLLVFSPTLLTAKPSADAVRHKVIRNSIRNIEREYGIVCCGKGLSMPGGPLRSIGFSFQVLGPLTKNDIRKIIVGAANELITQAKYHSIDEYLYEPPFGLGHVQINLFIASREGEVYHPDIGVAGILDGVITYDTFDSTVEFPKEVEITKETYEEAVALLKQEADAIAQDVLIQEPLACKKARQKPVPRHRSSGHTR